VEENVASLSRVEQRIWACPLEPEDLFFLPRVETPLGNLYRIRRQLLDTITWHAVRANYVQQTVGPGIASGEA
jgi:hypothetical protein